MFQELQEILEDLNAHVEGLEDLLVIQQDGTLLGERRMAENSAEIRPLVCEFSELMRSICHTMGESAGTEAIIRGKDRFLAIYKDPAAEVFLAIIGASAINFGLLNSGGRITIKKIHELLRQKLPQ